MSGIYTGDGYGDQVGTSGSPIDPDIGPLQNNSGPTDTMALLAGSPAIGAGGAVTTLTASATTAATTIYVTNAGAIASTPGQYDIIVDGEEMEVTNVNLSTNALTVTRAVNGVSVSPSSGDSVYLYADQRGVNRIPPQDIGAYATWLDLQVLQGDDPVDSFSTTLGEATVYPASGVLSVSQPLSFDLNSTTGGVTPSLVYNSGTVDVQTVLQLQVGTYAGYGVPLQILVTLTWNGTPEGTTTFTPSGSATAGSTYLLDVSPPAVASSGAYPWEVSVEVDYSGTTLTNDLTGTSNVETRAASPYGAGWGIAGIDQLLPTAGGVLWLYGTGQTRLFAPAFPGSPDYSNPEDFGSLVATSSTVFTYTFDGSTYTFTENATTGTFDLTSIVNPHSLTTTYGYQSSNDALTQVDNYDGSTASLSYSSGSVTISSRADVLLPSI